MKKATKTFCPKSDKHFLILDQKPPPANKPGMHEIKVKCKHCGFKGVTWHGFF